MRRSNKLVKRRPPAGTRIIRTIVELTGARTRDALHLAAARRIGGPAVPFLTFDLRQAQAARGLGLTVVGA